MNQTGSWQGRAETNRPDMYTLKRKTLFVQIHLNLPASNQAMKEGLSGMSNS